MPDDWIAEFLSETEGLSPEPFRLWAGITAVASVMERKCFTITDKGPLYPNLYALLSGPPGSGKTLMVNQVRELWKKIPEFCVGPDNPTKSAFLKSLMESRRTYTNGTGQPHSQSAIALGCREFGVLVPKHDLAFLSDLTDMFDNPATYEAPRTSIEGYNVENPTINILAGVTPAHLYETFPEVAWNQGFTSRLIFVFSNAMPKRRGLFANRRRDIKDTKLGPLLNEWHKHLSGEFEWTPDAAEAAEEYCRELDMPPKPQHEKLQSYVERREALLIKLSMISAVSAWHGLTVELSDFERAREWMVSTEAVMSDIFKSMIQRSDAQLIRDLHQHCWGKYYHIDREKRIPIQESVLYEFLQERTTSERIARIIESALKSGVFSQDLQQRYIPRSLDKIDLSGL